jgi:uncharacterized protein YbaR (Trm112 family)
VVCPSRILFNGIFSKRRKDVGSAVTMKRWLMDILACPAPDCRNKLELKVLKSHAIESEEEEVEEIDEALITCPNCSRWYPVIDGIACMLPDDQRMDGKQRIEERAFLERWKDNLPSDILNGGIPFGLSDDE